MIGRLGNLPGLGMDTGSRYSLADTGILGYALMASPTFGDAVDVACRYTALTASYLDSGRPAAQRYRSGRRLRRSQFPADVRQFSAGA